MSVTSGYCTSRFTAKRRHTREVMVGNVGVGGSNPVRVQSMTTTPTLDVAATVKQSLALVEAGCEIVRITAQNVKAAAALEHISKDLRQAGVDVPLVADIHFLPSAAMEAAKHVEKVRINPGNYADKKKFAVLEYSDAQYEEELQRLHDAFSPIVKRCKEYGRAMRIGTNHGSLSDRIMNRYGDSPLGMVESALEFIRICESHGFRDIILSMKASNPKVMIEAYRLVVKKMAEEGMAYPLHLGVTEAGDGDDARIKSTIGIGSLLFDGLGDTIRVSLTEDPVHEVPVAQELANKAMRLWKNHESIDISNQKPDSIDPFDYVRRDILPYDLGEDCTVASDQPPRVIIPTDHPLSDYREIIKDVCRTHAQLKDSKIEGLQVRLDDIKDFENLAILQESLGKTLKFFVVELGKNLAASNLASLDWPGGNPWMILCKIENSDDAELRNLVALVREKNLLLALDTQAEQVRSLKPVLEELGDANLIFTLSTPAADMHPAGSYRDLAEALREIGFRAPLWIRNTTVNTVDYQDYYGNRLLEAGALSGGLICDGLGDLISIEAEPDMPRATALAYNILQGARARVSKTEYVACPSCGRTLFDLQSTTQKIRARTGHLKGVTIAVMGCIVNGPGEMADADFGYVGGAPKKVNLYVGKECVSYHIPEAEAVDRLIDLIREHGKWADPEEAETAPVTA